MPSISFPILNRLALLLLAMASWFAPTSGAQAGASVQVVETWPAGKEIVLGRNQNFYLRLAYDTDEPVGIWIAAYYQGKQVNVGSSPSPSYSGSGEALGWFFFMQPGDEVDEIRIRAGDGSTRHTPVVATWHGHIVAGSAAGEAAAQPEWVTRMLAEAKAAQDAAFHAQMNKPTSAGDYALFNGFMLAMLALGMAGFAAPAWGLWRWRGGWRLAAAVPAAMMAFVVLRLVFDTARDPTSHNLWPFEILMTGALSAGAIALLGAIRKRVVTEE